MSVLYERRFILLNESIENTRIENIKTLHYAGDAFNGVPAFFSDF